MSRPWHPAVAPIAVAVCGTYALGAFLGRLLTAGLNHDEFAFIACARLLEHGDLYRDFGYNHAPYLVYAFQMVLALWHQAPLLLAGRLTAFACFATATGLVAWSAGRLARSRVAAVLAVVVMPLNGFMLHSDSIPIKDFSAMAATMAAFGALVAARQAPSRHVMGLAASGFLAGLAVGFKLTYAPFALVFAVAAAWPEALEPTTSPVRRLATYLAGLAAGLLPLAALAIAHPAAFWFGNVRYHQLFAQRIALSEAIASDRVALPAKLVYARTLVGEDYSLLGPALALAGVVSLALAAVFRARLDGGAGNTPSSAWDAVLLASAMATACVMALVPTPTWPHHFVIVVPFAIVSMAGALGRLTGASRVAGQGLLAGGTLATLIGSVATASAAWTGLCLPEAWTPTRVHEAGRALAGAMSTVVDKGPVATLQPIFPLEAGLPIYPELSTGPFFYVVGSLVPAAEHRNLRLTSPETLAQLLTACPPRAILTDLEDGWDIDVERPFAAYAQAHGYAAMAVPGLGGTLYVRSPR